MGFRKEVKENNDGTLCYKTFGGGKLDIKHEDIGVKYRPMKTIKEGDIKMVYGKNYNLFFKENKEITNEEKLNKLKNYSVEDTLTILRNIEESSRDYDNEIIQGVYGYLYEKGIMCI